MTQRELALEIIYKTISDKSYTNLLMRTKLKEISEIQRPFVTNLVNGVLRNYDYLLFQVSDFIKDKTSLKNKIILSMAIYERFYLKKEEYIVNNEYVNLAKNDFDKAFINAVLHKNISLKDSKDAYINNSLPKWLYSLLAKQYDETSLNKILANYKRVPIVCYRVNHHKKFTLKEEVTWLNEDIFVCDHSLINTDNFKNGEFYIQDYNSASLFRHLDLKEKDSLLDVCSAPGGKLFNCLDIVKPTNAYANELHENRLYLISNKAKLLGFDGINYLNLDGRVLNKSLKRKFDKVMLDVPCSGLGTLARKPDLKYHIEPSSLDELETIQQELLESCKDLVEDKGIILYSTCTLNKKENGKQVSNFLSKNANFKLLEEETIINDLGDCFYYAKLLKE